MRNLCVGQQAHHFRNRFVAAQQQLVSRAADFERRFFRERHARAQFDSQLFQPRDDRVVANPHAKSTPVDSQQHCELVEHAAHAARANRQNRIARARFPQHEFDARLHRAREHHILVARRADRFGQPFAGDVLDGRLARRVNFGDDQNVRFVERAAEIVPEKLRARVAVRLEEHEQALVTAAARRFERGANFRGMMAVVVNQRDAGVNAFDFKAPSHAGKFRKPSANQVRRNVQRERDGRGCGGIAHVVNSRRRRKMEKSQIFAVIRRAEIRSRGH